MRSSELIALGNRSAGLRLLMMGSLASAIPVVGALTLVSKRRFFLQNLVFAVLLADLMLVGLALGFNL
ncbi:MAG: hypothetical protein WD602_08405 [Actinomycetota bacterium]